MTYQLVQQPHQLYHLMNYPHSSSHNTHVALRYNPLIALHN